MPDHVDAVLLVGAGPMSVAYAQVLGAMDIPFHIIGRSEESAQKCREQTGKEVHTGGLSLYLKNNPAPSRAIVATGIEVLEDNTSELLNAGCSSLLVEKPGALNMAGIKKLAAAAEKKNADVFIAYNRRYYASVEKAKEMISEDGGLREIYFEFTEWSHVIEPLEKAPGIKEHWFLANSTHVVDLAFHLAGFPMDWKAFTAGGNSWHPAATRFAGSGVTERDVLFTYQADWEGPGRWGIELVTKKRRFYLRPMEQLSIQQSGSVAVQSYELNDEKDKLYKPGLYRQVKAWLQKDLAALCPVSEQMEAMKYYYKMAGYHE